MITGKRDYKEWIAYERKRYDISNPLVHVIKFFYGSEKDVIWSYQKLLRKTEYHNNSNHRIRYYLSQARLNRKSNKYGLHIGLNVCGKGLKILHLGPILTNGKTRMGENCSIHINTSFVASGVYDDAPVIGNNVVVGVGAVVVGGVRIADFTAIGANAVVCKDVIEENIAIAGAPAKKVSNNGSRKW